MNKFYLLSFDPHLSDVNIIHNLVLNCPYINDWWHYLGSTYVLSSTYTLNTITNYFGATLSNPRFLLIEVDLSNSNGYLPKAAWDWISTKRS